ncbi:MAG: aminoacyl-tRNA hydrolase [Candidatus Saccharibacteria bacterium]
MKIIFAQGNPEPDYALSRHNVGFLVLNTMAEQLKAKWATKPKFHAIIAEIVIGDEKVLLVKPATYYNETGISIRKLVDFYKINQSSDLLVIHDDLALPFGTIRVRNQGSDAGNNGIKSINSHIEPNYTRVRIGILNESHSRINDASFVLSKFKANELDTLKESVIPQTIELINKFYRDGLEPTSHKLL